MFVTCINNEFSEDLLTVGRDYKVMYILDDVNQYALVNDNGNVSCVAQSRFKRK